MLIDTHSHLNFKAYENDRDEVIQRLEQADIVCIDVGTKYETSKHAVELAEKYQGIYAAIGLHPIHIKTEPASRYPTEEFEKERYKELAISKKVVAIGEIGLDYYCKPKTKTRLEQFKQKQREVFLQQLELAEELNLPVIIHCRMAHDDLLDILKTKSIRGVIHCFIGSWEQAQQYIALGLHIGVNGIIYKMGLDEAIKKIPLDKILVETDCPYLTPPAEGKDKRNEPIFIKYIVQRIAELKEVSFNEVAEATAQNAKKLFGI